MPLIFDWFDKLGRYTKFKPRELKAAAITILVISFMVSFRKWGIGKDVDFAFGMVNLIGSVLIVGISFFARTAFQKIVALGADFHAEYKIWSFGLLLGLLLSFLTNGKLWFIIPGSMIIHYLPGHRLGWVRYGLNHFGIGIVSLAGPIANIFLAMIFTILYSIFSIGLFYTAFLLNIFWALWAMIPIIPATDGAKMFFGSRMVYMFALAVIVSISALLLSKVPIIITIPLSFIIGALWWIIYYIIWERFNWKAF